MTAFCALVVFSAMVAPDALSASPPEVITLRIRGDDADPTLGTFLITQIEQRWQRPVVVDATASVPTGPGNFLVDLMAMSGAQLSVAVFVGDRLLGERTLEVRDPREAQLGLWLFVRSSIERGMHTVSANDADPEPLPAIVSEVPLPQPPWPGVRVSEPEREEPVISRAFLAALVTAWLETPDLFAVGVSGEVGLRRGWLTLGAGLGYRLARGPDR